MAVAAGSVWLSLQAVQRFGAEEWPFAGPFATRSRFSSGVAPVLPPGLRERGGNSSGSSSGGGGEVLVAARQEGQTPWWSLSRVTLAGRGSDAAAAAAVATVEDQWLRAPAAEAEEDDFGVAMCGLGDVNGDGDVLAIACPAARAAAAARLPNRFPAPALAARLLAPSPRSRDCPAT